MIDIAVKEPIPDALKGKMQMIRNAVKQLNMYSERINAGKANEENTIKAKFHICKHDINELCGPEEDV